MPQPKRTRRWMSAGDWLDDRLYTFVHAENDARARVKLAGYAQALAARTNYADLEDTFFGEMQATGYFEPWPETEPDEDDDAP